MSDALAQYQNEKLWQLDESQLPTKVYVSVPVDISGGMLWKREHATVNGRDVMIYRSGEYEIHGVEYGNRRPDGGIARRTYTVWRQGVELSLSFTGSLRQAKDYAAANAQGRHRVNVA